MSSSDVRDILNLGSHTPGTKATADRSTKRHTTASRKPDGISRELYALIGDNSPYLAETQASLAATKYRDRPQIKSKRSKWDLVPFTPGSRRESSLNLNHWVRTSDQDPTSRVDYFDGFNLHGPSVMEFSQFEYDQHLVDSAWSLHETTYLFDMLRTYDLRFIVVADRYDYKGSSGTEPGVTRTVEDIKDRYYTICRRLLRTRTATDPVAQQQQLQAHAFDKGREVKRKQYASELYHLTAAEIAEEEALYIEVKRLQQVERRYRSDRDDLMRTVMGLDSGLVELDQDNTEAILGVDKSKKRKRPDDEPALSPVVPVSKKQKESAAFDAAHGIYRLPTPALNPQISHLAAKHPPHVPAFLRSTKMPTPKASAAIRITELLVELGINPRRLTMPTRANLDAFDGVLQAAGGLVDMKRQVDRVDQELRTLRAQREAFLPSVEQGTRRSESVTSVDTSARSRLG